MKVKEKIIKFYFVWKKIFLEAIQPSAESVFSKQERKREFLCLCVCLARKKMINLYVYRWTGDSIVQFTKTLYSIHLLLMPKQCGTVHSALIITWLHDYYILRMAD